MTKSYSISIGPLRPKGMEVTPAEKGEWVRRLEQSGLTLSQFSAQYGLRVASLRNWRDQYGPEMCVPPQADFREVPWPAEMKGPAWSVELELGNGKVLRLNAEVPEGLLEQLLRVC